KNVNMLCKLRRKPLASSSQRHLITPVRSLPSYAFASVVLDRSRPPGRFAPSGKTATCSYRRIRAALRRDSPRDRKSQLERSYTKLRQRPRRRPTGFQHAPALLVWLRKAGFLQNALYLSRNSKPARHSGWIARSLLGAAARR